MIFMLFYLILTLVLGSSLVDSKHEFSSILSPCAVLFMYLESMKAKRKTQKHCNYDDILSY